MADAQWPKDEHDRVIQGIRNDSVLVERKLMGQRLGYRVTKSARKAMVKDPTLFWGIFDYVMVNGLVKEEECYRHEVDGLWGMVFRVTMADPITVINKDVEEITFQ